MTNRDTGVRVWCTALVLALVFHAVIIVLLQLGRLFTPRLLNVDTPEPIDLVFAPASAAPPEPTSPSFFTELPPDREDTPPEQPDFLSNVDSRARDMIPGGDDAIPRLDGESEAPHVSIDPGEEQVAPTAEHTNQMHAPPEPPQERVSPAEPIPPPVAEHAGDRAASPGQPPEGERASRVDHGVTDPKTRLSPLVSLPQQSTPSRPAADFHQVEMYRPRGNAAAVGSVSLNTVAWAYAPWLQEFSRRLQRSWLAPVAYYMGIIHGTTELEMEVARDGSLRRVDVRAAEGHDSLRQTSVAVLEALAPYRPLPADFPEQSLILRIKLVYPPLRGRG